MPDDAAFTWDSKPGRRRAQARAVPSPHPLPAAPPDPVPDGHLLVPVAAWDKMLSQLGNLHEAGQQLADARERAAKAETEVVFLRERLAELRERAAEPPPPADPEPAPEPSPAPHAPQQASWLARMRRAVDALRQP